MEHSTAAQCAGKDKEINRIPPEVILIYSTRALQQHEMVIQYRALQQHEMVIKYVTCATASIRYGRSLYVMVSEVA